MGVRLKLEEPRIGLREGPIFGLPKHCRVLVVTDLVYFLSLRLVNSYVGTTNTNRDSDWIGFMHRKLRRTAEYSEKEIRDQ